MSEPAGVNCASISAASDCAAGWAPAYFGLHVTAHLLLAFFYLSSILAIVYFLRQKNWRGAKWIYAPLVLFLVLAGVVHVAELFPNTNGLAFIRDTLQLFTGILSLFILATIWRVLPRAIALPDPSEFLRTQTRLKEMQLHEWLHEKLKDNRDFLQTIIDNTSSIIVVKTREGKYLLTNHAFESLFGRNHGDIRGKSDADLFPQNVADGLAANDRAVFDGGTVIQVEEILPHEKGPHTYVSVKFPIRDENSEIYAVGCVSTDITHIKRVEQEIRKANTFLDSVIEHIPDMIFIKEVKDLRFTRFNSAGEKLLGLDRKELIGKNDYDFFPSEQADFFTAKDREVLSKAGHIDIAVEPIDTKTLGRRYLHTKKIALTDEHGEPEFLLGISQDITEQREASERLEIAHLELERRVTERTEELRLLNEQLGNRLVELQQAEERFRLAVESSPSAMVMIDSQGIITLVNAEAERVFGYGRDEMLGKSIEMLVPERLRTPQIGQGPQFRALFAEKQDGRGSIGAERDLYGRRKDGSEVPIEIGFNPITVNHETFTLSAIVDISHRKTADEFIRKALREKDLLLKEIHHRVKNNMQVISSLLKLQSAYLPNEDTRRLFKQSDDRVRSMALIHERLYRSEGFVDIDFSEYIKELSRSLFHSYVVDSRVALDLDLESVHLGIDQAIPCGLILNEVVSNCLKHAFKPGVEGRVRIRLSGGDEESIVLQVTDNGQGLPADFDIDRPTSLGMEIVRTLTEQLEGVLEIENVQGTSFTLRFLRHDAQERRRGSNGNSQHLNM